MRNVCDSCRWQKKRLGGEWNCLKYGIPMKYGRTFCVAYERGKNEQVREQED